MRQEGTNTRCTIDRLAKEQCSANEICPCVSFGDSLGQCDTTITLQKCLAIESKVWGDPHFIGFDGSRFDFHGVDTSSYVLFGEKTGETLVGKVRATNEIYKGVKKTYFDEFGLKMTTEGNPSIRFTMQKDKGGHYKLVIVLNEREIENDVQVQDWNISFHMKQDEVSVNTPRATFTVKGASLRSSYRHHLDFSVRVRKNVSKHDHFYGVLGMTLARKFGSKLHEEVIRMRAGVQLEQELGNHYGVKSLFPERDEIKHLF